MRLTGRKWRTCLLICVGIMLAFSPVNTIVSPLHAQDTLKSYVPVIISRIPDTSSHTDTAGPRPLVVKSEAIPASTVGKNVVVPEEHSATRALLLSIVPGLGQIYNGQAWKVPIIYGAFAAMGYFIYYNYNQMSTFKDEYLYRINHGDSPNLADYASYPTSNIYRLYNAYNQDYQLMVIITVGIYALNLIDAYVFGHLYEFRIDDDLSLGFSPGLMPTVAGLQPTMGLTLSF